MNNVNHLEQNNIISEELQQALADDQRIIVIGASAGGFEAFKQLIRGLPPDFSAPIFIVWHMSPDVKGILPQALGRQNSIPATQAVNDEKIRPGHIYVAPPDYHLLIERDRIRVTHGPKENRFRPAVDPLFRSAAYHYGNRVIGIILSGALGDGTAGLWTVKDFGGTTIVQDPREAEVPSMPETALREVQIDHCVSMSELPKLLVDLCKQPLPPKKNAMDPEKVKREIDIAAEENALDKASFSMGQLSPYTCPECHGVLTRLQDANLIRYRCHTGHAYSVDALLASITEKIEDSLYSAIRGMDESIILLNHLGDHYAEVNQPALAAIYFQKANEAAMKSNNVRNAVLVHQQLSKNILDNQEQSDLEDLIRPNRKHV
jgi:two-component system chemotaxis response regulator CheB